MNILDKRFVYTNAANTDIRKRFARIARDKRKEEVAAELKAALEKEAAERALKNVRPLKREKA